jgi:hypothetical protein
MSTQFYTKQEDSRQQDTRPHGHRPQGNGNGPSWFRIWTVVLGTALVGALIALGVTLLHSGSSTPAASGSSPAPAATSSANPAVPSTPASPSTPSGGHTVAPSAAVQKLQQQLGQLNYYEGPVDGMMGPQTVAAIKDLQRDAHLPQTGVMNSATQAALANFLAHGNNQMAG